MLQDKIFILKGKVMHYAWGGYDFIPSWLGIKNEEQQPFAEYWMGAHPLAGAVIETGDGEVLLDKLIKEDPYKTLGIKTVTAYDDQLPYLFKVQDVKEMLSIQVHPSKKEAEKGFAAEEAAGIPRDAPNRNYRDKNHKPEVMVALSEFWLLHGFLVREKIGPLLSSIPEFAGLATIFETEDYKGLYSHVMHLSQQETDKLLMPLVQREIAAKKEGKLTKADAGWWVAKLFEGHENISNIDRGVFSIYFFNIVKVNPGEGVYQGAGIPHAYLEGQAMELMANSDNVLRGGLTVKHVDIPELLKHTIFEGITPNIMTGLHSHTGEIIFPCPVMDFGLSKIDLSDGKVIEERSSSLEMVAVMEGELTITGTTVKILQKGQVAVIFSGEPYTLSTTSHTLAYKAFVP
ncbi:MAG TPA: mannose-6-phosphate isomerase, class I [Panacibacter sp.]|nr:mannose-6-phosphate isomerase, class I [Panacibacter sp.]HNP43608.1 mannose-6-phosphate isomerase, class I [Panacibacter sp.]